MNNKEPLATKNSSNGISKTPKDLAKQSLCQNLSFCLRSLLIPLLEMPVLGLSLDLLEQTLWGWGTLWMSGGMLTFEDYCSRPMLLKLQ